MDVDYEEGTETAAKMLVDVMMETYSYLFIGTGEDEVEVATLFDLVGDGVACGDGRFAAIALRDQRLAQKNSTTMKHRLFTAGERRFLQRNGRVVDVVRINRSCSIEVV